MRRRKICLAAILAAVMALQAPVMAFAEGEQGTTETQEVSDDESNGEENDDWIINGDVTITDDSWSSTDPENPTAEDESGALKNVSAWDDRVVSVNGDVNSTVSQEITPDTGDPYVPQAVDAGNGGTVNVNGNVASEAAGAVWVDGGTVNVTGNVSSGNDVAISVGDNGGTVHVGGDVTSQSAPAIVTNSETDISVEGDITGTEGVIITLGSNGDGTVELLGNITAIGDEGSAIVIGTGSDDKEEILQKLPTIVVGSLETKSGEGELWIGGENNENVADDVYEAVYQQILYYIARDKFANATLSVTGADTYNNNNGYISNEEKSLTVTIETDDGYEVSSVSGTSVVKNADGTYTVVVQRGKGIDINAVISAIVKAQQETSVNKNESSENNDSTVSVVVVPAYAIAQKQYQTAIASQLKTLPAGGTLMLDMKDCISFNKKTFEILAQRKDVDIQIIYTWKGKKYLVVIPAGYDILSLLDANGYCGCLYLNSVFGSTELTK